MGYVFVYFRPCTNFPKLLEDLIYVWGSEQDLSVS